MWLVVMHAEDPSPFPALSQIEVYGTETFMTDCVQNKKEAYEPERADPGIIMIRIGNLM